MTKKNTYPSEMKILMVCLGNICRSPLAEGLLRDKIKRLNLSWEVDSAGTSGWHEGERPDARIAEVSKKNKVSLYGIYSRKLTKEDLKKFDLILTMDSSNYKNTLAAAKGDPEAIKKIHRITEFSTNYKDMDIPDPYFEGRFETVFEMLDDATDGIISAFAPEFIAQ